MRRLSLWNSLTALSLLAACQPVPERLVFDSSKKAQGEDSGENPDGPKQGDPVAPSGSNPSPVDKPSQMPIAKDKPDQESPTTQKTPGDNLKESSSKALSELGAYLKANKALTDVAKQPFASLALTMEAAEESRIRIFEALKQREGSTRMREINALSVSANGTTMKYLVKSFGPKPANGHSLYISLHGGGQTSREANDGQWRNQINLYQPTEGIYIAPRAPTDTWNLWQLPHIDKLLERLIANYVLTAQVNPNRIYLLGYSAGGDGLYQLAPRLADRIAAGAMMAGHPGDASPLSLRNIGFSIHVGAEDTGYDRNKLGAEWLQKLKVLQQNNPDGYKNFGQIVAGKGHWMDLVDKEALPWMAGFTRNPFPKKISWHQDDVTHERFYWVRNDKAIAHTELNAEISGQTVKLTDTMQGRVFVRLNDRLMDLSKDIVIERNGKKSAAHKATRTIKVIAETLLDRADPEAVLSVELEAP